MRSNSLARVESQAHNPNKGTFFFGIMKILRCFLMNNFPISTNNPYTHYTPHPKYCVLDRPPQMRAEQAEEGRRNRRLAVLGIGDRKLVFKDDNSQCRKLRSNRLPQTSAQTTLPSRHRLKVICQITSDRHILNSQETTNTIGIDRPPQMSAEQAEEGRRNRRLAVLGIGD